MNIAPAMLWAPAAQPPELRPNELHLWRALCPQDATGMSSHLSPEEWLRASRFVFETDRRRFIFARGILRTILGRYLDCPPAALRFTTGPNGKPSLAFPECALRFNVSHSEDLVLLAVAHRQEVGVDVEWMRENMPFEDLAEQWFDPRDAWQIRILSRPEKKRRFFESWTLLEAGVKATGAGLGRAWETLCPSRWSQFAFAPEEGFAAALAVEGRDHHIRSYTWQS